MDKYYENISIYHSIDFWDCKEVFVKTDQIYLHGIISRHESIFEYYDLLFMILIKRSFDKHIFTQTIYLIYMIYGTLPTDIKEIFRISITKDILFTWI